METGEPGVKPPEPVIDVWRHQCLTHKVATSSCSVFLVNLCLLLVTNQVSSCKTGGIAKPNNKARDWYECLDSSLRIIYISVSVLEKPGRKVLMSPPRRDHLFCNNAYAVLTRETRTEIQTPFKKETLEELLEETDAEETNENPGPQGARQDKRPGPHHPGRCLLWLRSFFCTQSSFHNDNYF